MIDCADVKDGIITNVLVCETEQDMELLGLKPLRPDQWIGDVYKEPEPEKSTLETAIFSSINAI